MKLGELRALLDAYGLRPNARFGQNFLVDPALLQRIPGDAEVQPGDSVLEVGPGAGALTAELLGAGAQVVAVELDFGLLRLLRDRFSSEIDQGQLTCLEGDILGREEKLHPEVEAWWASLSQAPRLVANLPYAISGPFLGRLPGRDLASATLLLQREVAEKAASAGGKDGWSPLAIRLALSFHTRLGRRLPPEVFWPRPKVASAFLHLAPREDALSPQQDQELRRVLCFAFGQRRKALLGRLQTEAAAWAEALAGAGVSPQMRPGAVAPNIWRSALLQVVD